MFQLHLAASLLVMPGAAAVLLVRSIPPPHTGRHKARQAVWALRLRFKSQLSASGGGPCAKVTSSL